MGLLHGVAGPGGILGVLPAVEMQHWQSSTLYLGTFIITSTLSMGLFAACYGEFTRRLGKAPPRRPLSIYFSDHVWSRPSWWYSHISFTLLCILLTSSYSLLLLLLLSPSRRPIHIRHQWRDCRAVSEGVFQCDVCVGWCSLDRVDLFWEDGIYLRYSCYCQWWWWWW